MSDPAGRPRRYTDEETQVILARAAEMDTPAPASRSGELTLDDIVSVAREAGIDPAAVRRAAALVPSEPGPLERALLRGSARPVVRARFPGRIPPSAYPELTRMLDGVFGRHGRSQEGRHVYEWREEHGPGRTVVEASFEVGVTEVRVEADRKGWAVLAALGSAAVAVLAILVVGGAMGIGTVASLWAVALVPPLLGAAGVRVLFPLLTRGLRERAERAALLVGQVAERGSEGEVTERRLPPPGPPEDPGGDG